MNLEVNEFKSDERLAAALSKSGSFQLVDAPNMTRRNDLSLLIKSSNLDDDMKSSNNNTTDVLPLQLKKILQPLQSKPTGLLSSIRNAFRKNVRYNSSSSNPTNHQILLDVEQGAILENTPPSDPEKDLENTQNINTRHASLSNNEKNPMINAPIDLSRQKKSNKSKASSKERKFRKNIASQQTSEAPASNDAEEKLNDLVREDVQNANLPIDPMQNNSPPPKTILKVLEKKESHHSAPTIPLLFQKIGKSTEDFRHKIFSAYIEKSDSLEPQNTLRHPIVRMSIVDQETGLYLLKSDKNRMVTSSKEPKHIHYILPVITKPYELNANQTKAGKWDQEIVFNESYLHIVQPKTIVFFEIMDFVTTIKGLEIFRDGWNKVAWGFLKLIGSDGRANTEFNARLQLYRYPEIMPASTTDGILPIYKCWKFNQWIKYPSTIHIKLYAHKKLTETTVTSRPNLPTEIEQGKVRFETVFHELMKLMRKKLPDSSEQSIKDLLSTKKRPKWRRKPDEVCKLPNKLLYRISTGKNGSFSCAFSNYGFHLAIASFDSLKYPIKIYQIETGEKIATLEGHQDLVYQLLWSPDDKHLLSASSDGSVRVWSILSTGEVRQTRQLVHPSFVYTASFHPKPLAYLTIVTGAFDGFIRIWHCPEDMNTSQTTEPDKIILAHSCNINTLCFDEVGSRLYSGDGLGIIKIWSNESINGEKKDSFEYECIKIIDSLRGHAIQALRMHKSFRKLMVQTLGPSLHMFDTRIHRILTHFEIPQNSLKTDDVLYTNRSYLESPKAPASLHRISNARFLKCCLSPCGTYVFVGSVQGTVHFWRAESGVYLGAYCNSILSSWTEGNNPIVDISFHPHDHLIAFSVWGDMEPVRVYIWDEKLADIKMRDSTIGLLKHLDVDKLVASTLAKSTS